MEKWFGDRRIVDWFPTMVNTNAQACDLVLVVTTTIEKGRHASRTFNDLDVWLPGGMALIFILTPPTCAKLFQAMVLAATTVVTTYPGQCFLPLSICLIPTRRFCDQTRRAFQKKHHGVLVLLHRSQQKRVWWVASPEFLSVLVKHSQICHGTPDGQSIYPTCVMACSSKRLTTCRHGLPNANEPRPSDSPNMSSTPNISNKKRESPRQLSEPTPPSYADKPIEMCVVSSYYSKNIVRINYSQICNSAPVYIDGPKIYPTCGMACTSKLLRANDLPNTNKPRTSDPPSMSSAPNIFDKNRESPRSTSKPTRTFANTPIEMCVVSG